MAASSLANLTNSLRRIYTDEVFEYAQNTASPLVELLDEVKDITLEGEGYYWPFLLQSPQNIGTPAEEANLPTVKQRTEVQGRLRPGQFVGTFEITFILEAMGTARGSWNKGEVKKHSWECMKDLVKHMNRIYAGTYGSGKLAMSTANISASTTFTARQTVAWPYGALLLRPNMRVEAYNADASGTLQETARQIQKIVQSTRVVTLTAALTATGNPDVHFYIEGSYGQSTVPNGIAGLIDDGTLLVTIHNQSRNDAVYGEELKSVVHGNSNNLRDVTEDYVVGAALDVRQRCGESIEALIMNTGQLRQWLKFVRPDRRYNVTGKGVPSYGTGYNSTDTLTFMYDGRPVRLVISEDVSPRVIYGATLSQIRRARLRKLGWLDHGGGSMFIQGVNSGGLKTTRQATMYALENIGTYMPAAHFLLKDLNDPQLCGPAYGGTDS